MLTSQAYGKLTDAYAYNALDQLTEYVGYDGYQQEFTYDANGMRLSKSEVGNGNRSTLEELLRGNIAGLPEIVEPTQGQINADEADMPTELEWATTEYLYGSHAGILPGHFRNHDELWRRFFYNSLCLWLRAHCGIHVGQQDQLRL